MMVIQRKFVIRLCNSSDLEAVSALLAVTWHDTYDALYGAAKVADMTARWHNVDALAARLEDAQGAGENLFLVAQQADGRLIGTALAQADGNASVEMACLYVHPLAQRSGIGGALLGRICEHFCEARKITLQVEPANKKAVAFYQYHGFREAGKTPDCGGRGDNIPAMIMVRARRQDRER